MFEIGTHQNEYHNKLFTMVESLLPKELCFKLALRVKSLVESGNIKLVSHKEKGTMKELDGNGEYLHHIFLGDNIRSDFPELVGAYHVLTDLIASITCCDVIVSPYPDSDINIKAYPKDGGTIGWHYDTNGITVLVYLTTNTEAPLKLHIKKTHPSKKDSWIEEKSIFAKSGSMILMKGREVWHVSEPTDTEEKYVVVFNYYVRGDTWRPNYFDTFVYDGKEVPANEKQE